MAVGGVAVIGEEPLVRGFGLAGALVLPAADPTAARAAWSALPAEVAVVILTATAAATLETDTDWPLVVVMS
jgi:vacuolar-type H+-ATPase subunit F/Vma7